MELKEIIKKCKENFLDLYQERIGDGVVLLEEVEPLSDSKWMITLGFYEKDLCKSSNLGLGMFQPDYEKVYKVIFVDENGNIDKIKNYE